MNVVHVMLIVQMIVLQIEQVVGVAALIMMNVVYVMMIHQMTVCRIVLVNGVVMH